MIKMEIDDSAIISAIKDAPDPLKFGALMAKLKISATDERQLDRQLQRLKRSGIVRYKGFESGALAGWVLTERASKETQR